VLLSDLWDGYQAARARVLDYVAAERIRDLVILSGDLHSSWAFDVARDPWTGYAGGTGAGSFAVECVAPAVSSAPLFAEAGVRERAPQLRALLPTLKYLDGENRGYVVLDVTAAAVRADWHFVPDVRVRSEAESLGAAFVCERGSSHLTPA
jgi:alkaline phosphatase D